MLKQIFCTAAAAALLTGCSGTTETAADTPLLSAPAADTPETMPVTTGTDTASAESAAETTASEPAYTTDFVTAETVTTAAGTSAEPQAEITEITLGTDIAGKLHGFDTPEEAASAYLDAMTAHNNAQVNAVSNTRRLLEIMLNDLRDTPQYDDVLMRCESEIDFDFCAKDVTDYRILEFKDGTNEDVLKRLQKDIDTARQKGHLKILESMLAADAYIRSMEAVRQCYVQLYSGDRETEVDHVTVVCIGGKWIADRFLFEYKNGDPFYSDNYDE